MNTHYQNAKAVIGFLIVALGAALVLMFKNNQDQFMASHTYVPFLLFTFVVMALLAALFYLISQSEHQPKTHAVTSKKEVVKVLKTKKRKTSKK